MQHGSRALRQFGRQCQQLARQDGETAGEHSFFVGALIGGAICVLMWGGVALWVFA